MAPQPPQHRGDGFTSGLAGFRRYTAWRLSFRHPFPPFRSGPEPRFGLGAAAAGISNGKPDAGIKAIRIGSMLAHDPA